jgi:hypothetical protein
VAPEPTPSDELLNMISGQDELTDEQLRDAIVAKWELVSRHECAWGCKGDCRPAMEAKARQLIRETERTDTPEFGKTLSTVVQPEPEQLTDYERGHEQGVQDAKADPDPTWTPKGAWSDFERGYNAGYESRMTQFPSAQPEPEKTLSEKLHADNGGPLDFIEADEVLTILGEHLDGNTESIAHAAEEYLGGSDDKRRNTYGFIARLRSILIEEES